eukprot:TRINITY_DN2533_c0_g1_i1.p1 TRINITY_DN2533_c0_g1~~TRINITY_DN2533_c0_g1_i1.p1  ORF type:complete len:203 (+),score=56.27 TRINITY_DN2533_c0_g1_i1:158-766(+)
MCIRDRYQRRVRGQHTITMMKFVCFTVLALAALASANDFQLVFENTGNRDGISLYWSGVKEGPGAQIPGSGLESFQSFLRAGEKDGHLAKYGSRFIIRGKDSKNGPGFRAAVQIQKGELNGGPDFPYTLVVTAIGNEVGAKPIELVHRGKKGVDSKEFRWVNPGTRIIHLTHGSDFNAYELRDSDHTPTVKIYIHDTKGDEL